MFLVSLGLVMHHGSPEHGKDIEPLSEAEVVASLTQLVDTNGFNRIIERR